MLHKKVTHLIYPQDSACCHGGKLDPPVLGDKQIQNIVLHYVLHRGTTTLEQVVARH